MSSSHLHLIGIGDIFFEHTINTENDATYFKINESDIVIMWVDFSAVVYNCDNERIGSFRMTGDALLWEFIFPSDERIPTLYQDLLKAEVQVFKELVSRNFLKGIPNE